MRFNGIITVFYALLVMTGGMIGFIKADSVPSLIMGITFALGLLLSAVAMVKGYKKGFYATLLLAAILLGFFAYRYTISHQMMPAGFMSILSIAIIITLFWGRRSEKNHQSK
ncbi:MAG: TMEM14 family protein [Parachlamydiaceae bacterium]|nr:TMEM14 family protein [Parachlamydiaceae bacterium]